MHKKFEVNWTKIKGGCQSERKVSQLNSYRKMPLVLYYFYLHWEIPSNSFWKKLTILANEKSPTTDKDNVLKKGFGLGLELKNLAEFAFL